MAGVKPAPHRLRSVGQKVRSGCAALGVGCGITQYPMKKNVGSYDAAVRFIAGCLIVLVGRHALGWWSLLALLPVVSAATGCCFVYAALGISTTACDDKPSPEERAMRRTRVVLRH